MSKADDHHLLLPKRLKKGDTIAVAAPAGAIKPQRLHEGAALLRGLDFEVRIPDGLFVQAGYLAGSDQHRADLLNRLFADPDVDAIICTRGGYGALRILNRLDYQTIRCNPKPLIGFSDITAILTSLYRRCSMVTFHGPVLSTLATAEPETRRALSTILTTDRCMTLKPVNPTVIYSGCTTAPVLAGNLTTLCHLTGTVFAPDFSNHILVIEDHGEAIYRIDRMLSQMKLAGSFDAISGIALGHFSNCGQHDDIMTLMRDTFQDRPVPIMSGFAVGHGDRNLTLPIGLTATLDTAGQELRFHEPATTQPIEST